MSKKQKDSYNEKTYIHPYTQDEVFGDGDYFYTYRDSELITGKGGVKPWTNTKPNQNPLFVILLECTPAKLAGRGYRRVK